MDLRGHSVSQALVEFALVFPIMCFAALGFVEAGFVISEKAHQDRATDDIAEYAATHPGANSWNAVANSILKGCTVTVTAGAHNLVLADSSCAYTPKITSGLWPGLVLRSSESAVVPTVVTASPAPS